MNKFLYASIFEAIPSQSKSFFIPSSSFSSCQECCLPLLKCTISLGVDISFCLCIGDSTYPPPLAFLWQPLAPLGCHITPSPLCCLSSSPSPSSCLPHCLIHSACVLSVAFCTGVITGQPKSHFLQWAVCLLSLRLALTLLFSFSSPSFSPPAGELPVAFVRHLYTQDTLSLTDVTHNTLHGWHLIPIPWSLSPSAAMVMCKSVEHTTWYCVDVVVKLKHVCFLFFWLIF